MPFLIVDNHGSRGGDVDTISKPGCESLTPKDGEIAPVVDGDVIIHDDSYEKEANLTLNETEIYSDVIQEPPSFVMDEKVGETPEDYLGSIGPGDFTALDSVIYVNKRTTSREENGQ
jgi:hypothetical protein